MDKTVSLGTDTHLLCIRKYQAVIRPEMKCRIGGKIHGLHFHLLTILRHRHVQNIPI